MKTMKDYPEGDRPYEKCFSYGARILSDTELLSVILRNGVSGKNAYELSAQILSDDAGSVNLLSLMHIHKEQLMMMRGIGPVKTCQILCISELAQRISTLKAAKKVQFNTPRTIAEYYMERLRHLEREQLYVLYLDSKCNLIKELLLTTGSINQSLVANREIFLEAFRCNAVHFLLVHNHPSGDPTPSGSDIVSSQKLKEAGQLIGIGLLDHIIIGDMQYRSLKELNVLK